MIPILAAVLSTTVMVAAQGATASGSIVGCLSHTTSGPLPGATVVAKSGDNQRTTVTDSAGCYELTDLPPTSYRVTARLLGFDNVTRDRVVVAPATATRVDLMTPISTICECIRFGGTLVSHLDHADAVLHMRLSESDGPLSTLQGYYPHRATVISRVKQPTGPPLAATLVLQNQRSGGPGPYDVGQELVAFLEAVGPDAFRMTNDEPGLAVTQGAPNPSVVFLVEDGRIQHAPSDFSHYVGTPIDAFLEELRTLSRRN